MLAGALRAGALALITALLLNPAWGALRSSRPLVALDVSLSWMRASDSSAWLAARKLAVELGGDSVLLVGNSLRFGSPPALPLDTTAPLFAAAERAQLAARSLTLITDGEAREEAAPFNARLPIGSRIHVLAPARRPDVGITGLETPPAALTGDTLILRAHVAAAQSAPSAVDLIATADGRVVARRALGPFAPWEGRTESMTIRLPPGPADARLSVTLRAPGDGEPRNDSASRTIHRGQRIAALAVSTSPDFDFREIARVMRGALPADVPARFRVARDRWVDESGRAVAETQLRVELRQAQVVVLHGDTAYFGDPRAVVTGALALIPAVTDDSEWYVAAAPSSPLAPILGALPLDSLPPVAVGMPPRSGTPLVEVRSTPERRRVAATLEEGERRVIVVPIRGTARWSLRGGAAGDAFASFWGAVVTALADRPGRGVRTSPVNVPQAELHPRRAALTSLAMEAGSRGQRAPLRSALWPYALIVVFLCAEWVLRRRAGLR